ncbi:MAG: DUF192 domain-containing protein [Candidatus Magasanikbacteria bacterium]|nr:DUF192 domain-containing protein [Candidatus Magasanikbacteria bacterium]
MLRIYKTKGCMERSLGLIGRKQLKPGEALYFARVKRIHTWFMKYSIDAVFTGLDERVLSVQTLFPWKISSRVPRAFHCYELLAGEAVRLGIVSGQRLWLDSELYVANLA